MSRDDVVILRWLVAGLVFSTSFAGTARLWQIFQVDGLSVLEILVLIVFAVLFSWIATSFWIACLGAHALWRTGIDLPLRASDGAINGTGIDAGAERSRTVLAAPIYHEDSRDVFARLHAIEESLAKAEVLDRFDFFVLSDSSDPDCCRAEEEEFRRWRRREGSARIFYRRRPDNHGHKSGNIAEFCENWGALYDYMVVLDADSLMTGATLAHLVGLMDANPHTALIQAAPILVGGNPFLRAFSSSPVGCMDEFTLPALPSCRDPTVTIGVITRSSGYGHSCSIADCRSCLAALRLAVIS